jgi:hypothetical protein
VWDGAPLFAEPVEAWVNGPVVRDLFEAHRGCRIVSSVPGGDASRPSAEQGATVRAVVNFFGRWDAEWLAELTHRERPWRDARSGLPGGVRGWSVISSAAMAVQYAGLGIAPKVLPDSLARGLELLVLLAPDEVDSLFELESDADAEQILRSLESGG